MNKGFTLIELVVIIVLLGILGAVAIPRFVNMGDDAEKKVVETFVGALKTATVLFHSKVLVTDCSRYGSVENFHLIHAVALSPRNNDPLVCTYYASDNRSYPEGHTIGTAEIRRIMADPDQHIAVGGSYPSNQGDEIRFTTKRNRVIDIVRDPTTGEITWTAVPAY